MVIKNVDYLETVAKNMSAFGGFATAQSSTEASAQGSTFASVELINYAFSLSIPGHNVASASSSSSAIALSQ